MKTIIHKTAWLLAALLLTGGAAASAKSATIRIKIALSDLKDTVLVYTMNQAEQRWDTPSKCLPTRGVAQFDIPLKGATNLFIYGNRSTKGPQMSLMPLNIRLVGMPGEALVISGTSTDYHISGTSFYRKYGEAVDRTLFRKDYQQMIATYADMQRKGASGESLKAYMQQTQEKITQRKNAALMNYIRTNAQSETAVLLLSELDLDHFFEADQLISQTVKAGRLKNIYDPIKESFVKSRQKEEAAKRLTKGAPAPDFTLDDLNGQPLSLKSLRGKYVILDFWGSWCGWCIKGFPEMKKYYEKYKERLEILGIDCRDTEARWKKAVSKHALPWLQVRNTDETAVEVKYAIAGYPTKVIIDPDGKIDRIVVGEDPKFYEYIDQLMAR